MLVLEDAMRLLQLGQKDLTIDERLAHKSLASACLQLLFASLKQDIYGLGTYDMSPANLDSSRLESHLSPQVQYACGHWTQHVIRSGDQIRDNDEVHHFLKKNFLYWLEALAWIGKVSDGILAIAALESSASHEDCSDLIDFIRDAGRFVRCHHEMIAHVPLQVYCSALVFTPTSSIIRQTFSDCIPKWLKRLPDVESNWGAPLQTLESHTAPVNAVAFSSDGQYLASGSCDKTVKLWDIQTGVLRRTFDGHEDYINTVAFSPDGRTIASASRDTTIRLWDTQAEGCQILRGHSDWVWAIAFSRDGGLLISSSNDMTVRLWNWQTGVVLQILEGHTNCVSAVALSTNGKLLASASKDTTTRLWDTHSGRELQILKDHSDWVWAVAFSPDDKLLATASRDGTARLRDMESGIVTNIYESNVAQAWPWDATFSSENGLLATAWSDRTIKIWSIRLDRELQVLRSHSDWVLKAAFSPDSKLLASASSDATIKLWNLESIAASGDEEDNLQDCQEEQEPRRSQEGGSVWIEIMAFSPDGSLLASASANGMIQLWDVQSGAVMQTLEGHSSRIDALVFSPHGGRPVLASASRDKTVKLWDPESTSALHTFEIGAAVKSLSFSHDGSFLQSDDDERRLYSNVLSSSSSSSSSRGEAITHPSLPRGLYLDGHFLSHSDKNLLWLPIEHRKSCIAIYGNIVALASTCSPRQVSFMDFHF